MHAHNKAAVRAAAHRTARRPPPEPKRGAQPAAGVGDARRRPLCDLGDPPDPRSRVPREASEPRRLPLQRAGRDHVNAPWSRRRADLFEEAGC